MTTSNSSLEGSTESGVMNMTFASADTERTVLYVSNSPDKKLADFLAASAWHAVHAKTTASAERMIERDNIKVGLIELPQDCTSQQLLPSPRACAGQKRTGSLKSRRVRRTTS